MAETNQPNLNELQSKLDALTQQQQTINHQLEALKIELVKYKLQQIPETKSEPKPIQEEAPVSAEKPMEEAVEVVHDATPKKEPVIIGALGTKTAENINKAPSSGFDLSKTTEAFIGGNLINKIGIAITVIGVGIGAKYSIDHDLISPLMRLLIGYVIATGLLGFAFKLKEKYTNFSAVLLGGSMAIMYFLTYLGYSLYDLFNQPAAFGLMLVFTAFTVLASTRYNMVVIAHIGLIGAYAVPFLLSNNSGKVEILFTYMLIINSGILFLAFKRNWRSLHIPAFALSWMIFLGWYFTNNYKLESIALPLGFGTLFFLQFYAMFLAQALKSTEKVAVDDTVYLLSNAFLYYLVGFSSLHIIGDFESYKGLFTVANALVHFGVAFYLFKTNRTQTPAFNLTMGIVLIFITLAIPVQLDGKFVTIMWLAEAIVLTWVGVSKQLKIFERLSLPVLLLGLASLFEDWNSGYNHPETLTFLLNTEFLNSILASAAIFGLFLIRDKMRSSTLSGLEKDMVGILGVLLPALAIGALYAGCMFELNVLFTDIQNRNIVTFSEGIAPVFDPSISLFEKFWGLAFTQVYFFLVYLIFHFAYRERPLFLQFNFIVNGLMVLGFMVFGLYNISEMRALYLHESSQYFEWSSSLIYLRYIGLALLGLTLYALSRLSKDSEIQEWIGPSKDLIMHTLVLWLLSSELLHWLDIASSANQYKLALSILFGLYALFIIVIGLWKRKKLLRLGGFTLFGITLVKLFFYDIAHLGTIPKTIVFISLGVLLLIVSFLYNKYKHIIDERQD